MMVPEAWQNDNMMPADKKAFYRYNAFAMEPWDGPALLAFSDGRYVGAVLDRNGLRPSRYYLTDYNYLYMASEVGVCTAKPEQIVQKVSLYFYITTHQPNIPAVSVSARVKQLRPIARSVTPHRICCRYTIFCIIVPPK